jgi:hypothetical protein
MSLGIEFERAILEHLQNHKPVKSSKELRLPNSSVLFAGICIGTGLAAHALLLGWK